VARRKRPGLWGDEGASVAPTIGLALFALVAAGGIAFDYARMATMDTELQSAADQAALAAASQLDGAANACSRASAAAVGFVTNRVVFSNHNVGTNGINAVVPSEPTCDAVGQIKFWQEAAKTNPADTDANARFVEVTVNGRQANFALTPVVAAFNSGTINATAMAGLGSAICKVPPLMICNPNPGTAFVAANNVGKGIVVVAHQQGQSWSAGNFGFLNVGQANNGAPDLLAAMAYQNASLTCQNINTGEVDTGATVPAIDAANTRFDIYNFASGSGSTLGACYNGSCPSALNVTKDLIHPSATFTGNNECKIHNQGWQLITGPGAFSPRAKQVGDTPTTQLDDNSNITAMGLPRDNCHYTSYGYACPNGRIGDGNWARGDYFNKYHPGATGYGAWTRYQTYLWEIANNNMPGANGTGVGGQYGAPKCSSGALDTTRDRRVFTVAIADNCANLSGSSVPVQIGGWVDMFFVEPGVNGRGNGSSNDEIYLEVIREAETSGDGTNGQIIRRDVPYLVE
jgi:Flp pilus assembly protein TadG